MPAVDVERDAIPEHLAHLRRANITTTTLFTLGPSAVPTGSSDAQTAPVPVGAIAGGVAAGAILAILVTVGWICWGRVIKRTQAKQRREAEARRTIKRNTLHNAHISKPRSYEYRPLFARPLEKKVKFAAFEDTAPKGPKEKEVEPQQPPPSNIAPFTRTHNALGSKVIFPERAVSRAQGTSSKIGNNVSETPQSNGTDKQHLNNNSAPRFGLVPSKKLPRRPRSPTIDSASASSVYSEASGEERQYRARTSLILAALGNLGNAVDGALNRNSFGGQSSSSGWSFFSRSSNVGADPSVPVGVAL